MCLRLTKPFQPRLAAKGRRLECSIDNKISTMAALDAEPLKSQNNPMQGCPNSKARIAAIVLTRDSHGQNCMQSYMHCLQTAILGYLATFAIWII
jgi:hypothetical protein